MTEREAFKVLGLPESALMPEIREAYRSAAVASHPDQGGERATFERVIKAWHVLRETEHAREDARQICPECLGKRFTILTAANWQAIKRLCATCRGTGRKP